MKRETRQPAPEPVETLPGGTWLVDLLYDELDARQRATALARVNADATLAETLGAFRRVRVAAAGLPLHALPTGALEPALGAARERAERAGTLWERLTRWWRAAVPGPALASAVGTALIVLIALRVAPDGEPRFDAAPSQSLGPEAPRSSDRGGAELRPDVALALSPEAEKAEKAEKADRSDDERALALAAGSQGQRDDGHGHRRVDASRSTHAIGGAENARTIPTGASRSKGSADSPRSAAPRSPSVDLAAGGRHAAEPPTDRAAEVDSHAGVSVAESMMEATARKRVASAEAKEAKEPKDERLRDDQALDDEPRGVGQAARWRELRRRIAEGDLAEAERLLKIIVADEGASAETRAVEAALRRAKSSPLPSSKSSLGTGLD